MPVPLSVICVFNDPEVRHGCLDYSIERHSDEAAVEYLAVNNMDGSFASAGAALNYGASLASNDFLVFVHQDVYLHSLRALEAAASVLANDEEIGVVGAVGVDASGRLVGRIRDRVVLLGEPASEPTDVASLDELLFMTRRSLVQQEPLAESPELAWHAYAVEYGLRVRSLGLRVCALDIPLTHNSLTTNVDRLDVARRAVARTYPDALPVRVPGGTIVTASDEHPSGGILSSQRWRYRWLRESLAAHVGRLATNTDACVLADIRWDIDELISSAADSPLLVINLDHDAEFSDEQPGPLELTRRAHQITLISDALPWLIDHPATRDPRTSILLTNLRIADLRDLRIADLRSLSPYLDRGPRLLGFRREIGYWLLLGPAAAAAPRGWHSRKSTPLGMPEPA